MIFKFYFSFVIKLADIVSKNIPNVCWESKKGNSLHIPFDGVPYLHLNTRQYNCHQGKDKNVKIKENHRAKQQAKLCSDHSQYVKTWKWSQPTKKLDCPVKFNVVKIYCFPEFKINKDTSWKQSTTSKKKKAYFSNIHKSYIENQKKRLRRSTLTLKLKK